MSRVVLVILTTVICVWIVFVVLLFAWRITPHALPVHLIRPGVNVAPSPGIQPLVVRVTKDGPRPGWWMRFVGNTSAWF